MVQAEPSLLADLFAISRPRMHLIALALAHLDTQVPPEIGPFLVRRLGAAGARPRVGAASGRDQAAVGPSAGRSAEPRELSAACTLLDE